ncbi:hypothetical protein VTK56DRAFT_562 [Thermocarpiscus australiensis]
MDMTCTSTGYSTVTGCNLTPTTTTAYTLYNCPTFPAWVAPWSDYTAGLPTPGDPGWGGFVLYTGTYSTSTAAASSTPTANDRFSSDFSNLRGEMGDDDTLGPGSAPIRFHRRDSHEVNYDYRAEWVARCVTAVEKQSFGFPLGML